MLTEEHVHTSQLLLYGALMCLRVLLTWTELNIIVQVKSVLLTEVLIQYQLYLNSWGINRFLDSAHVDVRLKHGFSLLESWKVSLFHFGTFCINTFSNRPYGHLIYIFRMALQVSLCGLILLYIPENKHSGTYFILSLLILFSLEFEDGTDLCKCNISIGCIIFPNPCDTFTVSSICLCIPGIVIASHQSISHFLQ